MTNKQTEICAHPSGRPRRKLLKRRSHHDKYLILLEKASWRSGDAADCKAGSDQTNFNNLGYYSYQDITETSREPDNRLPRRGWVFISGSEDEPNRFVVDLADEYCDGYSRLAEFIDRPTAVAYAIKAAKEWNAKLDVSVFGS